MTDILKTALGTSYCMFYHPAITIDQLTPVQTFDGVCQVVNRQLSQHNWNLTTWPGYLQDEITRLLWVNLFYQNLDREPIQKPVLCHQHHGQLVVDCGDTRLMTLALKSSTVTVSAVVTCLTSSADQYSAWTPVTQDADLIAAGGFDPVHTKILITPTATGSDHAMSWMEISSSSTAHHMHSVDQRLAMMQKYLRTQSRDFEFDADWARNPINWLEFA